jgi:glycosyltransferase involved in cell wall biosynthesis
MVFEVRDLWPELPIAVGALKSPLSIMAARRLERFAYDHACRIIALSPGMKEGIVRTGYPSDRVTVIPNSCDFDLFDVGPEPGRAFRARHAWLQDRPLVVYTGTLGEINKVEYLAQLAASVATRDPLVAALHHETWRVESGAAAARLGRDRFRRDLLAAQLEAILTSASLLTSRGSKSLAESPCSS